MDDPVRFARDGEVAILTLDNPPVNALSHRLRVSLQEKLEAAQADPAVTGVVLAAAGRSFCGGAEIREFNTPAATSAPLNAANILLIERMSKPVVAAIQGVALGGGCEVALGCHFRVASPGAKIGLPEIKLGLLPGAGGTQRMPRLVGVAAALDIILSGDPVDAAKALKIGLVDAVLEGDIVAGATAFLRRAISDRLPLRRTSELAVDRNGVEALLATRRADIVRRWRGYQAPVECLACVEDAITLPFAEGSRRERERFLALLEGGESKAMRHLFFAEREAQKLPLPQPTRAPTLPTRAAVIGAGTMGTGIAICFADAGIPVVLLESAPEALARSKAALAAHYDGMVRRGRLSAERRDERLARIVFGANDSALAGVDVAIEAVFEDMATKRALLARLDSILPPEALIATNTSALDVNVLATATSRPDRVIGLHFFSPAQAMRLVEVVRGAMSSDDSLRRGFALARGIGKVPVLSGVCDGFIGNRVYWAYRRQAEFMVEEGAAIQAVDRALEAFGFRMGPFAVADLTGLEIGYRTRQRWRAANPDFVWPVLADRLFEAGRRGRAGGAGWYSYAGPDSPPAPDPAVDELIAAVRRERGSAARAFDDTEIVERAVWAMVNEGARVLDEGIAVRASDIDVVFLLGYGFPAYRGGPMFHADATGLAAVVDRIAHFRATSPPAQARFWEPAAGLVARARAGERFN